MSDQPQRFCPYCGGGNPADASFCTWCAKQLPATGSYRAGVPEGASQGVPPASTSRPVYVSTSSSMGSRAHEYERRGTNKGLAALLALLLVGAVLGGLFVTGNLDLARLTGGGTQGAQQSTSGGLFSAASTPYSSSRLGVSATLPGDDWVEVPFSMDNAVAEMWKTTDNRLLFNVVRVTSFQPKTMLEARVFVNSFANAAVAPPYNIVEDDFHGYPALRLDGTMSQPKLNDDYREVVYFFTVRTQLHFIAAGSKSTEWDDGGKEAVEQILESVSINR